jgi:hypothetical protein
VRKPVSDRFLGRVGAAVAVAGAALVLMPSASVAQAHSARTATPATAPTCSPQANHNDPTDSHNKVLDGYWFAVNHKGHTTSVCNLLGNVQAGDVVTAHFTVTSPAPAGAEITLASYYAAPPMPHHQNLFACASYGVAPDTKGAGDPCVTSSTAALTVTVPDCGFQVDLIYGEAVTPLVQGTYENQKRFISGSEAKFATCSTPTPTPTATPTPLPGGGGGTSSPSPGGVQAISVGTPSTGAGLGGVAPAGLLMVLLGGAAVAFAVRRRAVDVP